MQCDMWLCMELMDTSLHTFYKVLSKHDLRIPEDIIGKITVSVSIRARSTLSCD